MRIAISIASILWMTTALATLPGPAAPAPAAPGAECRPQNPGERPSATSDDIVNCVVQRLGPSRAKLTVTYTYASPLGNQNILLGVDMLADGNRLKWFGYRPAPVNGSSGTASIEVVFGVNNPPAGKLTTDQIEFFMYVGGGQIFYRKMFALKHDWQL
ncbi:MAG: hypothetical protein ACRDFW_06850 [bacterium]